MLNRSSNRKVFFNAEAQRHRATENPKKVFTRLHRSIIGLFICLVFPSIVHPQTKFDQFGEVIADDAQAYLDLFAQELQKQSNLNGVLLGYRRDSYPPGAHLRSLYGYFDYLVDKRGVADSRLQVVDGGVRDKGGVELWLVPQGSTIPAGARTPVLQALIFDEINAGDGCWPEFTLDRYEPKDAVKFYAGALKEHPEAKGIVFINPSSKKPLAQARKLISDTKAELEKYGLPPNIIISYPEGIECHEVNFWLMPATLSIPPVPRPEQFLFAQLLLEAEENEFAIRRVEFVGNTWIRDYVLRRKIPALNEGEIFRREVLNASLASLSTVPSIYKVRPQDVINISLDRPGKTIDLMILVRPRPKKRR